MGGNSRKPHLHVTAGLIWRGGRILIAKRPPGTHLAGYWEFPGGKVRPEETLRDCVVREMEEELGVQITAEEPFLSVQHDYGSKRVSLHVFNCRLLEGEPRALQGQEIQWVIPTELQRFSFPPPDERIIEYLVEPKE
jgi:mutator protein MutT